MNDEQSPPEEKPPVLARVRFVPALQGAVLAFLLAMAMGFLWGIVGLILAFAVRATPESIEAFAESPVVFVIASIVALIPPLVGGYYTARATEEFEVENGAAVGVFYVVLSAAFVNVLGEGAELLDWHTVLQYVLEIAAAVGGAVLRRHVIVF